MADPLGKKKYFHARVGFNQRECLSLFCRYDQNTGERIHDAFVIAVAGMYHSGSHKVQVLIQAMQEDLPAERWLSVPRDYSSTGNLMCILDVQTHVARQIVQSLGSIPSIIILSQVPSPAFCYRGVFIV